jgi:nicotinate-nucleotide pyrophosphorylase (carboxylating)
MSLDPTSLAVLDLAIAEDVGSGDWTTRWTVPPDRRVTARIVAKADGVIAGTEIAGAAFHRVDPGLSLRWTVADGDPVAPGQAVLRIEGDAAAILTAERVALNFLQRLSGVATLTRRFVDCVAGTGTIVLDTRKTTPGLRALEKAAVFAGGGRNHRFGLHDMVLIKENHIRAAGGITEAVDAVRRRNDRSLAVEVEATTLDEVREALEAGVDRILFDNMDLQTLRAAVSIVRETGRTVETEASGMVSLESVRGIAESGVDFVSTGAITHSAPALDLSLLVDLDD